MPSAIHVRGLTKRYARYAMRRQFATFKSALLGGSFLREVAPEAAFSALTDVSFDIQAGSTVAVVGPNGSGKSTLLKVLAGILKPTSGVAEVRGRVAALLELGAGFHPEISGRENIIINGIMLGLSRREIEERIPEIIRFAELEDFIDAPVKTYSSGMYIRLGFSVAVAVEPDVLLVDEVLAVGDESFSHKCIDRFADLKRRGRTVLLVTHALELAEALADRVLLFERGRLTGEGTPRAVIDSYRSHVAEREEQILRGNEASSASAPAANDGDRDPASTATPATDDQPDGWQPKRWGNRKVEIRSVAVSAAGGTAHHVFQTGQAIVLDLEIDVHEPQADFVFGIAIRARDGRLAYGTNTEIEGFRPLALTGRATVRVDFPNLLLLEGSYSVDAAVHTRAGVPFDYRQACLTFSVRSDTKDVGVARLPHAWSFRGAVELKPRPADTLAR